jgi:amidase
MLGFGYALEQKLGGTGHLAPATAPRLAVVKEATAPVGGMVPATLALTLGAPASFGAFAPGVAKEYTTTTTANVISTAGDATLSIADPSPMATGHLVNGTFALPSPLKAAGSPLPAAVKAWAAPTSNEAVPITFTQAIGTTDALRTGTYAKTLTFTLSTTTP